MYLNLPPVSLDALAANREPETESASIDAALLESAKEIVALTWWEAAALICDFYPNAIGSRVRLQRNVTAGPSKLYCVLQEVRQCCPEGLRVGVNGHSVLNGSDGELDVSVVRLNCGDDRHLFDESGDQNTSPFQQAGL